MVEWRNTMKKNAKRLFAVILSLAMVCGSMLTVNAASTTRFGEYGGGSYSTNLTIQTDRNYVSASVSCSPESPSDVYSVRLLGNARSAKTGLYDVFQASGAYNSCYTQKPGEYVYASCAYYIGGSQVEFMELFA